MREKPCLFFAGTCDESCPCDYDEYDLEPQYPEPEQPYRVEYECAGYGHPEYGPGEGRCYCGATLYDREGKAIDEANTAGSGEVS